MMLPGSYVKLSREMSLQKWLGATSDCVGQSVCALWQDDRAKLLLKDHMENIRSVRREKGQRDMAEGKQRFWADIWGSYISTPYPEVDYISK